MSSTLIKNATIVNEGRTQRASVLIENDYIAQIYTHTKPPQELPPHTVIDATGMWLLPGVIDDHVHMRDPGLTHKASMATESRAAAAGGVTTVFDMPNCIPQTTTLQALQDKFRTASQECIVNHSFYLGATHDNIEMVGALDPSLICGVKLFMGSSTGGMLLNDKETLKNLFCAATIPVAVHCEEPSIIDANMARYTTELGCEPPVEYHHLIRSEEACYSSTSRALDIAAGTNVHLHILHISTARELALFGPGPLESKQFTAEACPAHLWFDASQYKIKGTLIKCNPAVKSAQDRDALRCALTTGQIDVIGTDHAPHLLKEKQGGCRTAASGMPVLPYSLPVMLELTDHNVLPITQVVQLMCHNPATLFQVKERGFIRPGFKADLTLLSHDKDNLIVGRDNNYSKCSWSPFEGEHLSWRVSKTWVNGHLVYDNGQFNTNIKGEPILFNR